MVSRTTRYYTLTRQGKPRQAVSRAAWQAWMRSTPASKRVIAQVELAPGVVVETMFDGVDKGEKPGIPMLWSTKVYGVAELAGTVWKWSSVGEAIEGHKGAVDSLIRLAEQATRATQPKLTL